jgi:S-adenosylmethionine decarboxylase
MKEKEFEYSTVGNHITVDLWLHDFNKELLDDLEFMRELLKFSVSMSGANILGEVSHKFDPVGFTTLLLLSESHASMHSYVNEGYLSADVYTCGNSIKPEVAISYIVKTLKPKRVHYKILKRGLGEDQPIQIVGE